MKKQLLIISLFIVLVLMLSSCATILEDGYQNVAITSEPEDAIVKVNGIKMGTTPLVLPLECDKTYMIEIAKEGFETQYGTIKKKVRVGYQVVDFIVTGFIGNVIDLVTPNGYKLEPDTLAISLIEKK